MLMSPIDTDFSPTMQSYLRERVRLAEAEAPWLLPETWPIQRYACLGEADCAAACCRELLRAAQTSPYGEGLGGLIAVFDQLGGDPLQPSFASRLSLHLHLMEQFDARLRLIQLRSYSGEALLQVLTQRFGLVCLHAQADQLSRITPCPVLAFAAL